MTDKLDFDRSKLSKNININLSGKDYMQFCKYEDNKTKRNWKAIKELVYAWRYFISAGFIYGIGQILIVTIFPIKTIPITYGSFEFFGLVFPYLLLYIMIILIGLAWLIHGFGFIIIKR